MLYAFAFSLINNIRGCIAETKCRLFIMRLKLSLGHGALCIHYIFCNQSYDVIAFDIMLIANILVDILVLLNKFIYYLSVL